MKPQTLNSFEIILQNEINLSINLKTYAQLDEETENFTRHVQSVICDSTKKILM